MRAFIKYLLLLLLSTGDASAEGIKLTARQALINMTKAMKDLNYQGTVAFFRNGKLETMKYFHASKDGVEQERLLSLNSPLREVVRTGERVSCRFKNTRQVLVDYRPYERSFLVDMPNNMDGLEKFYDFEMAGEEEIAMLPSYVVAIHPKDEFRYNRKVWIEKRKFLPLKVAVYDFSGETLEQIVFADQEVKDKLVFVDVQLPDGSVNFKRFQSLDDHTSAQAPLIVTAMPPGFREIFFTHGPMRNSGPPVNHLVLSDGFSIVSVYMENKNSSLEPGMHSVGATHTFSRVLDDNLITVMGEVPAATVKMMAESVKLKNPN
ncbi:MAG: MucB/RseB C-terminal domain-containing protein [Gammaproteobacteria bacterium]